MRGFSMWQKRGIDITKVTKGVYWDPRNLYGRVFNIANRGIDIWCRTVTKITRKIYWNPGNFYTITRLTKGVYWDPSNFYERNFNIANRGIDISC